MFKMIMTLTLSLILLSGCSSKSLYQWGQNYQKNDCINKAVTAEDHQACEKLEQKSFEAYEKERTEISGKNAK